MTDSISIGKTIAMLRADKGITQAELGERIGVSFQAVSKWERGETIPDVAVLTDLADILESTVDFILRGGKTNLSFKGKICVSDLIEGINCLKRMGDKLGTHNIIYRYAVDGINQGMNTDVEAAFSDEYIFEAFVAEAIIQNLRAGYFIDSTDVRRSFKHEHFRDIVLAYLNKYNIV